MRFHPLSWLGILFWLSYGITLWPLPPDEVANTVALYKRFIVEPSPIERGEWKSLPAPEQEKFDQEYQKLQHVGQEIINRSDQLRGQLWLSWSGRAVLLFVGLLGWLSLIKLPRTSRALIAVTTGILIAMQIFSHSVVYSELLRAWGSWHSGMKYLPWGNVLRTLYLLFVLPIMLAFVTSLTFWPNLSNAAQVN